MTRILRPCGTYAAYQRHMRNNEKPCTECFEARRAHTAKYAPPTNTRKEQPKVEAADITGLAPVRPFVPGDWRLKVYGSMSAATEHSRRPPRKADRNRILAIQGDVCLYCGIPIGTLIERRYRSSPRRWRDTKVILRRNWDHFVPYSFIVANPGANWVLACHICNNLKRARLFDTVDDARAAILPEREKRGYEPIRQVFARIAMV